ncbi:radical SAM protein [Candidatus Woesearchaeota archaeon]|nr:radical SAM protein [Candidatus Woesearchaeota archaeon]
MPTNTEEGRTYYNSPGSNFQFDVIIITGDPYYDHPLSGTALVARLLDTKGHTVAIIPQPINDEDYQVCGFPKYFFCITSGLLDSMLANYTPMLRKRENVNVPERALIAYTSNIKRLFKGSFTVIGGVEATIRRFAHFDYWDNKLRKGILNDTKADVLIFGNAERPLLNLLDRFKNKINVTTNNIDEKNTNGNKKKLPEFTLDDYKEVDGIAFRVSKKEMPKKIRILPSFEDQLADKEKYNLAHRTRYLLPDDAFIEQTGLGFIQHNRASHPLTEQEMNFVYSINFTRKLHPLTKDFNSVSEMLRGFENSVILGRGCWAGCHFCVIPLVQGKNIAKRSKESIIKEIKMLYEEGNKKINDLTMPTINMYGSYCALYNVAEQMYSPIIDKEITVYNKEEYCNQACVGCKYRVMRDDLIPLLEEIEKLNKKHNGELEIRSAIRHDLILEQKQLFRKIMQFVSRLKIAPEHISNNVLAQMNKSNKKAFEEFLKEYRQVNKEQGTNKNLVPYFVVAHPGSTMEDMKELRKFSEDNNLFVNLTQVFTPTPEKTKKES